MTVSMAPSIIENTNVLAFPTTLDQLKNDLAFYSTIFEQGYNSFTTHFSNCKSIHYGSALKFTLDDSLKRIDTIGKLQKLALAISARGPFCYTVDSNAPMKQINIELKWDEVSPLKV